MNNDNNNSNNLKKKTNFLARHKARKFAVQALYQWQMSGEQPVSIKEQFLERIQDKKCDQDYFAELILKIPNSTKELDEKFTELLDREISQLNPVELAILRLSCYEMLHHLEIPYKVVINEAVELAKQFGAEGSHKYVNGVLDKLSQQVRRIER